jgi:hypothetical protein
MGDILFENSPLIFETVTIVNGSVLSISFGDAQESVGIIKPIEIFT